LVGTAVSIELMVIFIVLKIDAHTAVGHWSWFTILVIPLATAAVCITAWLLFRFYVDLANEQQMVEIVNARDFLKDRRRVNVYTIESYSEASVFRHSLLLVAYIFLLVYGALVARTPCSGCTTPYSMLAISISVCYAVRLGLLCYSVTRYYAHYRVMSKEIFKYQHEFDKIGESRMFNDVVPDLYWPNYWEWGVLIDAGIFAVTLAFAVLGTIWTNNNECALRCTARFHNCQFLLYGMWTIEGLYVVTAGLLRYFKRSSGVEALQDLFNALRDQSRGLLALDDKARGGSGSLSGSTAINAGGSSRRGTDSKVQKLRS